MSEDEPMIIIMGNLTVGGRHGATAAAENLLIHKQEAESELEVIFDFETSATYSTPYPPTHRLHLGSPACPVSSLMHLAITPALITYLKSLKKNSRQA